MPNHVWKPFMAWSLVFCAAFGLSEQACAAAKSLKPTIKSHKKYARSALRRDRPSVKSAAEWQDGRQVGYGGWYGAFHEGKKTASGARFDPDALTAAHPSMPFNSLAKVTNLSSGKSITVRVTDRGPYVRGRIIDISERAAHDLGIRQRGVARVSVERVTEQ
ncbi:MAG: septal ring lytic transglycosylase RlpA family protein [Burkholderiaceae bacterium]|jgi:rare lipoprotein A